MFTLPRDPANSPHRIRIPSEQFSQLSPAPSRPLPPSRRRFSRLVHHQTVLRIKVSGHSPGSRLCCTCTTRPERPLSARAKPRPEAKIIGRVHGNVLRILRPVQRVSCRQKPCIVNLVNHVQQRRKCNLPDNCSNCQNQAQRKLRDGVSRRRSLSRDGGRYDGDEQPAHECCNRVQSDGVHRYMFRC